MTMKSPHHKNLLINNEIEYGYKQNIPFTNEKLRPAITKGYCLKLIRVQAKSYFILLLLGIIEMKLILLGT